MSIKLPHTIRIGPYQFNIKRVGCIKKREAAWGMTNSWKSTIKIKRSLLPQNQAVVLMHEIVHALLWTCGEYELNQNEAFVDRFSEMLIGALWHSPGLLRYLKETKR